MANPISDATLGSRFWLKTDFSMAAPPQAAPNGAAPDLSKVKHNSTIFTFVNAGGDTMANSAIGKAELFAASHTLAEGAEAQERERANNAIRELLGEGNKDAFVNEAADALEEQFADMTVEDRRRLCETALMKLMATDEFDSRAKANLLDLGQNGNAAADRRLGANGLASLKNAILGLATMLKKGTISEKAVLFLANGNYYDASNRADLLRLASASANKVKQMFVGEERMKALIQQCKDKLATTNVSQEDRGTINNHIADLERLMKDVVVARTAVAKCIKTNYELTDSTGEVKKDTKFQKQELDRIRNSLRAFRYDLDNIQGKQMGFAERIRRNADNFFSSKVENRITPQAYQTALNKDRDFNNKLAQIRTLLGNNANNAPVDVANRPIYAGSGVDDIDETSTISLVDSARAATHLSHLTNDRIRYHYSGVEKNAEKDVRKALGDIGEKGGSRSVMFRAGLDFVAGLDLGFISAKLKAGGALDIKADVKVANGNGPVEVTYSFGGKGHAGLSKQIGVDPKDKKVSPAERTGFGLKVEADANLNLHHKVTKTYANFDDFVRATGRYNVLVNPQISDVVYKLGKGLLRGIGHLFILGANLTHLRIHRSRMDQLSYSAALRNNNVFGPLSGVFLKKRNVAIVGERKALVGGFGVKAAADGGIFVGEDKGASSNFKFGGAIGYDYTREGFVRGKTYESFAKSFEHCSANFLANRFTREITAQAPTLGANDAWTGQLRALVDGAVGNDANAAANIKSALGNLADILTALEDSAIDKPKSDKQFWTEFAARARILAVAAALLTKRAEELADEVQGAADAKIAARNAVNYVIPRLTNPIVKLPSKLYQEKFFNEFKLTTPPVSTHTGYVELSLELFDKASKDFIGPLNDKATGKIFGGKEGFLADAGKEIVGNTIQQTGETVVDVARDSLVVLNNKLQVKVTRTNYVGGDTDPRPWLKGKGTTLDLRVNGGMTLSMIINAIARAKVKSMGGLGDEEVEKQDLKQAFKDMLLDTAKAAAEESAVDSILPLMDITLGELSKKHPVFGKALGALHYFDEVMDADHNADVSSYKLLRFKYGGDGRFEAFYVNDDTEYDSKLTFKVPWWSAEASLEMQSKTSTGVYSVLIRPSPKTLLGRAADYLATGNADGFKTFLAKSKLGVARVIDAGRENPGARDGDKYWEKDCQTMRNYMASISDTLDQLENRQGIAADEVAELRRIYEDVEDRVKHPQDPDMSIADKIDLASEFFTIAAKIFNLAALYPPPAGH